MWPINLPEINSHPQIYNVWGLVYHKQNSKLRRLPNSRKHCRWQPTSGSDKWRHKEFLLCECLNTTHWFSAYTVTSSFPKLTMHTAYSHVQKPASLTAEWIFYKLLNDSVHVSRYVCQQASFATSRYQCAIDWPFHSCTPPSRNNQTNCHVNRNDISSSHAVTHHYSQHSFANLEHSHNQYTVQPGLCIKRSLWFSGYTSKAVVWAKAWMLTGAQQGLTPGNEG